MATRTDIFEARALLEKAEAQADPELKAHELEEALNILDGCDLDDTSAEDQALIANLRLSHARRLLLQFPTLLSVTFDIWFAYFRVLIKLRAEVESLIASDAQLRENHARFTKLWRQELLDALRVGNAL